MAGLLIPAGALSAETLKAVIEDFVTREGTEYGAREVSLEAKIAAVRGQLERREAVLVFDADTDSISIRPPAPEELVSTTREDPSR